MMQVSKRFEFALVANPVAAASTAVNSSAVDTAGFRGCVFLATIGSGTTSGTFTVQQAAATSGSWSAITGASQAIVGANDNKLIGIDVVEPRKRYLRSVFETTAGSGTWDYSGTIAGLYSAGALPTTAGGGVLGMTSVVAAT